MTARDEPPQIGVDVGGTHVRVGVVENGEVVWERRSAPHFARHCRADRPDASLAYVVDALAEAIGEAREPYPQAASVGLAIAGFLDARTGRIARSPNLPGIEDADVARPLSGRLGLPVVIENDALAAAWGEAFLAPAPSPTSLLYVGLGTGVGGGLVLDGRPWRGGHGFAMEVGHVIVERDGRLCGCGNRGCLERYASATGVRHTYRERTGSDLEAHEIAALAHAGDEAAQEAFARAGETLAVVLACLVTVLDVPDVVIGGGLSASWRLMRSAFDRRFDADLLPVLRGRTRVRISTSGDQAGMLGAARLSAKRLGTQRETE